MHAPLDLIATTEPEEGTADSSSSARPSRTPDVQLPRIVLACVQDPDAQTRIAKAQHS